MRTLSVLVVLLKLEIKRMIKNIPYFLTGAIVLVLLAGTIAFSGSRLLYGGGSLAKFSVGVAMPEDDKLVSMALSMISSMDSVNSLCDFQYTDENTGMKLLKEGKITALLKIPERLIQGIIDGTNLPATVVFPAQAGIEASVFKELTEAGASMLRTSQAAIYAVDEYLQLHHMEESTGQAEQDLNSLYLKYALNRGSLFKTEKVSAAGDVSITVFYAVSAAVLVLLLLGIPAAPAVRPYEKVMEQKLYMMGVGRWKRTAVRTACLFLMLLLASAVPFMLCAVKGYLNAVPAAVILWILVCTAAAGWILFLYELAGSGQTGILILFISTVVMLFMAGGFIPQVFLPDGVSAVGGWTPAAFLMDGVKAMVTGEYQVPAMKLILMEIIVFAAASAVRRDYE